MRRFLFLLIALILFGCSGAQEDAAMGAASAHAVTDSGIEAGSFRSVKLDVKLHKEEKLQQAVDEGWQAWRKDPIEVAHAALIEQGVNATPEDCRLTEEHETHALIELSLDVGDFRVHCERLVRDDGIWTATEVEVKEKGGGPVYEQPLGVHQQH